MIHSISLMRASEARWFEVAAKNLAAPVWSLAPRQPLSGRRLLAKLLLAGDIDGIDSELIYRIRRMREWRRAISAKLQPVKDVILTAMAVLTKVLNLDTREAFDVHVDVKSDNIQAYLQSRLRLLLAALIAFLAWLAALYHLLQTCDAQAQSVASNLTHCPPGAGPPDRRGQNIVVLNNVLIIA
jgi:hypothetical protein